MHVTKGITEKGNAMKFFAFLLMLITSAVLFSINPNKVLADTTIISDDFESYTPDTTLDTPSGVDTDSIWKFSSANTGSIKVVKDADNNNYGSIDSSSSSMHVGQNFSTAQSSGLVYEFDMSIPSTASGTSACILMYDSTSSVSTKNIMFRIDINNSKVKSKAFAFYSNGKSIATYTYSLDKWYHVKAVMNIATGKFDLDVTDKSSGESIYSKTGLYLNTPTCKQIGGFDFQLKSSTSVLNVDNVKVTSVDSTLSSIDLGGLAFNETYSPTTYDYTVTAEGSTKNATITPASDNADNVDITVNDTPLAKGASYTMDLVSGANNVTIEVKSKTYPRSTSTYRIEITRVQEAPNPENIQIFPMEGKAFLTWSEPDASETTSAYVSTNIYNGSGTLLKSVTEGTYEAVVDGLTNGALNTLVVKAQYTDKESKGSTITVTPGFKAHQMEALDRGLVAMKVSNGVFLSWRLFGNDPSDISFNLYRDGVLVNSSPITTSTNYLDTDGQITSTYQVVPVLNSTEGTKSASVNVVAENYLSIPLDVPQGGTNADGDYTYNANDCSVGDVDGDGQYEMIVKWDPSNSHDNSLKGLTGNVYLDAYKLDGTKLWRIDLGKNIRAGAHYTQFQVYDLDGDGKAEVACRTSDGTVDGTGAVIGDASADYVDRNPSDGNKYGQIISGKEYLTIFNGLTGAAMKTIDFQPARGSASDWGDDYGGRSERFLATIAYLDGQRPSLIMCRGYYEKSEMAAYNWRDGNLTMLWKFSSADSGNSGYAKQGNHGISVADVDYDGKDEIIYGACVIDDNGTGLFTTGKGHGDAMHVSNLDPSTNDLEVFKADEDNPGAILYNARTGKIIWEVKEDDDCGRALSADVDPNHPGEEMWAAGVNVQLRDAKGNKIGNRISSVNFAIWWDGDLLRELLDGSTNDPRDSSYSTTPPYIAKYDYTTGKSNKILTADGCFSNNSTKATPNLQADILGDWREEAVWRSQDSKELRIYTTTNLTDYRIYTLMHDLQYRESVAWQNTAYNQPPHTSFFIGANMPAVPTPNMYTNTAAPAGLKLAATTENSVSMKWNTVENAVYYNLYKSDKADGTFVFIGKADGTEYTDKNLNKGTQYFYSVSTVTNSAESPRSTPIKAIAEEATTGTIVLSAANVGSNTADLSWTSNLWTSTLNGTVSYNVYENGKQIAKSNKLGMSVSGLIPSTDYTFVVTALNASGKEIDSNAIKITTLGETIVLSAKTIGHDSAELSWASTITGTVSYNVYQNGKNIGTTNDLGMVVSGLTPKTDYSFVVTAMDASGSEVDSNAIAVTTLAEPPAIKLKAISTGKDMIVLNWTTPAKATGTVSYEVYKNGQSLGITNNLFEQVTGLTPITTYNFDVKAIDSTGTVFFSNILNAVTGEPAKIELNTVSINAESITLGWKTSNIGMVTYEVYKNGQVIGATKDYQYVVLNLTNSTKYNFVVKAIDESGNVVESNTIDAVTSIVQGSGTGTGTGTSTNTPGTTPAQTTPAPAQGTTPTVSDGKVVVGVTESQMKIQGNTAAVSVDESTISAAVESAKKQSTATAAIQIPEVKGVTEYTVSLPASVISDKSNSAKLEIESKAADVVLPSDLLAGSELKDVKISIGQVESKNIPESVKDAVGSRPVVGLGLTSGDKAVEGINPSSQLAVSIPYTPSAEELKDPEHIVVNRIDASGNLISVPNGRYNTATGKVTFTADSFGQYTITYVNKTFDDIAGFEWAKASVEVMAAKGVVKGTSEKTFSPDENVTRADFTVMLVRALGLKAKSDNNFADVSKDDYYYSALGIAKSLGLIKGDESNRFNPAEEISRQDMMVIAERALQLTKKISQNGDGSSVNQFTDSSEISSYAKDAIAAMVREGIVKGNGSTINPLDNTTRAESAVIIYRIFNK